MKKFVLILLCFALLNPVSNNEADIISHIPTVRSYDNLPVDFPPPPR